jgi:SPP1 family predicted phage head-tail adaptor
MEPGRLRHRVVVEQVTRTGDAMGQAVETWTTFTTVWADVQPLRGRELFAAQAANSEATTKVYMRYRAGISPKWRLKFGTQVYQILEIIDPGMRHVQLQFVCKELPQSAT